MRSMVVLDFNDGKVCEKCLLPEAFRTLNEGRICGVSLDC